MLTASWGESERRDTPWLTWALLGVLVVAFLLERHVAGEMGHGRPDTAVLVAVGGVSRHLVFAGGLHRLFLAPLLHANTAHLVGNGIVFILVGTTLERVLGPLAVLAVFGLGGLAGTLFSIALNPPAVVSVGASGAIMALNMTLLVVSAGLPSGRRRAEAIGRATVMVLLGLVPAGHGAHVDYACHLGGGLLGAVYGLLVLRTDANGLAAERLASAEKVVAAGAAGLALLSAVALVAQMPDRYATPLAIPDGLLPVGPDEIRDQADALRNMFPHDPRSHMFLALKLLRLNSLDAADRELRTALALAEGAHGPGGFPPSMAGLVRGTLAVSLAEQGRRTEARALARPVCEATGDAAPPPRVMTILLNEDVCPLPTRRAALTP